MEGSSVSDDGVARAYDSGDAYDAQYSALYAPEIRTLTQLAEVQEGPVLDLCCGTGIVTVPLARTGLPVVGVDISEAMLDTARRKAAGQPNLRFVLQDALAFDTLERFALVLMTGNAFQCFLTNEVVRALLHKAYDLLRPGGVLIFDTRLPEGTDLTVGEDYTLWSDYTDADGNPAQFLVRQAAYDAGTGVLRYEMKDVYADGRVVPSSETLKFTPLETLLGELQSIGFGPVAVYGGWNREPLLERAASSVFEARKP